MIFEQRSCLERERERGWLFTIRVTVKEEEGEEEKEHKNSLLQISPLVTIWWIVVVLLPRPRPTHPTRDWRIPTVQSPLPSSPLPFSWPSMRYPRCCHDSMLAHCSRIGQSVIHNADDRGFLFYIYNKTGVDEKKGWKGRASRRDKTWPGQRWGQNRDPSVFPWGEEGGYVIPAGEWRRQRTGWQIYGHLSLRSRIRNRSTDRDRCVSIAREKIRFFRFVVARLERRKERLDVRVIEAVTTWIV